MLARIGDDLSARYERHQGCQQKKAWHFHFSTPLSFFYRAYSQSFSRETSELSQVWPMPMPWTIARSFARISL